MLVAVLLRDALLTDLPALMEIQHDGALQALAHIFPQDTYPFPREAIRARWASEIADPNVQVYVIERDGRPAGFAAIRVDELLHFGTAVGTWGTGFAAAAHSQVVTRLVAAGVAHAWLRVFEDNQRARRFYEKQGWSCTQQRSRTLFPPHPVLVRYELDLSRPD